MITTAARPLRRSNVSLIRSFSARVARAIRRSGSEFYASVVFTEAGVAAALNIAKWDGSAWSALASGAENTVRSLAVLGTDLIVGGGFSQAAGHQASFVAIWDTASSTWPAMGSGAGGSVHAILAAGTDLYVGGSFTEVGGVPAAVQARIVRALEERKVRRIGGEEVIAVAMPDTAVASLAVADPTPSGLEIVPPREPRAPMPPSFFLSLRPHAAET